MEQQAQSLSAVSTSDQSEDLSARLKAQAERTLDDIQLISLLVRTGQSQSASLATAKELLNRFGGIHGLGRTTFNELVRTPGMNAARASVVLAALELGRRRTSNQPVERQQITNSSDAYSALRPVLTDLSIEEFWVLLLDRGNRIMERQRISIGGVSGTVADPKCIYHAALNKRSSSLIVAHNHPSGQLRPSEEDIQLTRKLVAGGQLLDVKVQDHLIVTDHGFYSFADNGMM